MRLWSLHPKYLDSKGLVACWREALLAQKVLLNQTKGYKNHPQLNRFKATHNPVSYISEYLRHIYNEGLARNYSFDYRKIYDKNYFYSKKYMMVTDGQLKFEYAHLLSKLKDRDKTKCSELFKDIFSIKVHPLFNVMSGQIESLEKV